MLRRPSALDQIVQNFQHNWETNPQFRAMWSGGLGLAIVVMLCACLGFAFTFASAAASAVSGSTNNSSDAAFAPSGTVQAGSADNTNSFPTATIPPWPVPQIPQAAPIPPSTTPEPTPSPLPTATPVPTTATGPGNGNGGGNGNNGNVSVTGSNPSPLKAGANGAILIKTSAPNSQININIIWPSGANDFPAGSGVSDGQGNASITVAIPADCSGNVRVMVQTDKSGSGSGTLQCTQ